MPNLPSLSLKEWRHAVTIGDRTAALAGVKLYPAMTPRGDWPGSPALVDALYAHLPQVVFQMIRAASSRKEDLNQPDQEGWTVLDRVLAHQHRQEVMPGSSDDLVPLLVMAGADPGASRFWKTIVECGSPTYVKECLKAYPAVHRELHQEHEGEPGVLHIAAGLLQPSQVEVGKMVRRLLRAGARQQGRDDLGRTPWMLANWGCVLEGALDAGVTFDACDDAGNNLLHHLVARLDGSVMNPEDHAARLRLALKGASLQALLQTNADGETPLDAWWRVWESDLRQPLRVAMLAMVDVLTQWPQVWTLAHRERLWGLSDIPADRREQWQDRFRAMQREQTLENVMTSSARGPLARPRS